MTIQERDANNVPQVTYTRGTDLSGSLEGAGGIDGLLARVDNGLFAIGDSRSSAYYHADGNGNITVLINTNQVLVARYEYDSFGNILSKTGPLAEANLYRFSSKEYHANSGLVYYLYRFYDPNLQRWPNRDPIEEPGFEAIRRGVPNTKRRSVENLYIYAGNEPNLKVDPFGLSLWLCLSPAFGLFGLNHVYMWDDSENPDYEGKSPAKYRDCAMQSSWGMGPTHQKETVGPPGGMEEGYEIWYGKRKLDDVRCTRIPNTDGKERKAMDCCEEKANRGLFLPFLNDCHRPFNKCMAEAGIPTTDIPPHPRVGGYPY